MTDKTPFIRIMIMPLTNVIHSVYTDDSLTKVRILYS